MLFNTFRFHWTELFHHLRQTPAKDGRHACQVVGGEGERGLCAHLCQADKACIAQPTDGFIPTEYPFLDDHSVAGMARGPPIDGAVFGEASRYSVYLATPSSSQSAAIFVPY